MIYFNTKTIDTLTSLATKQVASDKWRTYAASNGRVSFYTHLANDDELMNDTLRTTTEISDLMDNFELGMGKWQTDQRWVATGSAHTGRFCLKNSPGSLYENHVDNWAGYKHSFNLSGLNAAYISTGFKQKDLL